MARTVRDSNLENRTARLQLKPGVRHWRGIGRNVALGYRRGTGKVHSAWIVRWLDGAGHYRIKTLAQADDHRDADGMDVLGYFQAMDRARVFIAEAGTRPVQVYTVAHAMRDYLEWFAANRKSVRETELTVNAHILPALGHRPVADLLAPEIRSVARALRWI